jgi:hypothetical protein
MGGDGAMLIFPMPPLWHGAAPRAPTTSILEACFRQVLSPENAWQH